jgi:hypothetical protein
MGSDTYRKGTLRMDIERGMHIMNAKSSLAEPAPQAKQRVCGLAFT